MQTQISTNYNYINLIKNKEFLSTKIRRLSRKSRYCTFRSATDNSLILIGLYQKRKELLELETCRTVEKNQTLISKVIDDFFEIKKIEVIRLISKNKKTEEIESLFSCITDDDIRTLEYAAGELISGCLTDRFKFKLDKPMVKLESVKIADLYELLNLVRVWLYTKNISVDMAEHLTEWSNRVWVMPINNIISSMPAPILEELNIGQVLLKSAGLNYSKEKYELYIGLIERVTAIIDGFKLQIKQELCQKAAEIIYTMHDEKISVRFEEQLSSFRGMFDYISQAERA